MSRVFDLGKNSVHNAAAAAIAVVGAAGVVAGQTAPQFGIERIGLYGPEQTGAGGVQSTTALTTTRGLSNSASGYVGTSNRYSSTGASNGENSWFYSRLMGHTFATGLFDAAHTGNGGYQLSRTQGLVGNGRVIGHSVRVLDERTSNGQDAWVFDSTTGQTTQIGLGGLGFTGSNGYQSTSIRLGYRDNWTAGTSVLVSGVDTTDRGGRAWVYSPLTATTREIGLTDAEHTGSNGAGWHTVDSGTERFIIGSSTRVRGLATMNGEDPWVHDVTTGTTVQLGLTGLGYSSPSGFQVGVARFVSESGQVVGRSNQFLAGPTPGGFVAWVYRPSSGTSTPIGLLDAEHTGSTGSQRGDIVWQNQSGIVFGNSYQMAGVSSLTGLDTWDFSPATGISRRTNLTDAEHTGANGVHSAEYSPLFFSTGGDSAVGRSTRYSSSGLENGHDVWLSRPGEASTVIGLTGGPFTGSAGRREVSVRRRNADDFVTGVSNRFTGVNTSNGQSAWRYDPVARTSDRIGLSGPSYQGSAGYEFTEVNALNSHRQVSGFTTRVLGTNTTNGSNTWVYRDDSHETLLTGLTGPAFTGSAGYQYSENFAQNEANVVVGFSRRIRGVSSTNGQNAWYFDPALDLSIDILDGVAETVRSSDSYAFSSINVLTDDGFALGRYTLFAGGAATGENRLFLFRPDIGFNDLASLVTGGVPGSGWASLSAVQSANLLGEIVGYGLSEGQPIGSQSAFLLRQVPAPSSMVLMTLAGVLGARRRRAV